jgi:hypothetical protein
VGRSAAKISWNHFFAISYPGYLDMRWRPWLTILAPILISVSRKLVRNHRSAAGFA